MEADKILADEGQSIVAVKCFLISQIIMFYDLLFCFEYPFQEPVF